MHRAIVLLCGIVITSAHLSAAETKLPELKVGQRIFRDIVILGVDATDLYFRHEGGIRNVKLRDLQPELQKMFGYNPERAAEIERWQLEQERQFAQTVTSALQAEALARLRGPETLGEDSIADALIENAPLNKPMPALVVEKWLSEAPPLTNKLVIVCFLKTTSVPCQPYIGMFNEWQKKYAEQLTIIGISPEANLREPSDLKIEFALGLDPQNRLAKAVGVNNVPQILLVDPKGVVRYCGHPAAITEKILHKMCELFGLPFEEQKTPQPATATTQVS